MKGAPLRDGDLHAHVLHQTGQGDGLIFFCHDGAVEFDDIEIRPVLKPYQAQ
jgi:hypothetical protein